MKTTTIQAAPVHLGDIETSLHHTVYGLVFRAVYGAGRGSLQTLFPQLVSGGLISIIRSRAQ